MHESLLRGGAEGRHRRGAVRWTNNVKSVLTIPAALSATSRIEGMVGVIFCMMAFLLAVQAKLCTCQFLWGRPPFFTTRVCVCVFCILCVCMWLIK